MIGRERISLWMQAHFATIITDAGSGQGKAPRRTRTVVEGDHSVGAYLQPETEGLGEITELSAENCTFSA